MVYKRFRHDAVRNAVACIRVEVRFGSRDIVELVNMWPILYGQPMSSQMIGSYLGRMCDDGELGRERCLRRCYDWWVPEPETPAGGTTTETLIRDEYPSGGIEG